MKIVNWLTIALTVTTISNYAEAAVSLSEIKRAAQTITPTCAYVSVENVKKINGIQRSSQLYEVEFTYTARLTTPPENNKINTQMALVKKERAETEEVVNKPYRDAQENYPNISFEKCMDDEPAELQKPKERFDDPVGYLNEHKKWEEAYREWIPKQKDKCNKLFDEREAERSKVIKVFESTPEYSRNMNRIRELDKQFANFAQMKAHNFFKVCPASYGDGYKKNNLNEQYNFKQKPAIELVDHHLYGAKMIRTDNGWMLSN